jgi:hypothetical protein
VISLDAQIQITRRKNSQFAINNELLRGKWLEAISANGGFRQSKTRKKTHKWENTFICGEHFPED